MKRCLLILSVFLLSAYFTNNLVIAQQEELSNMRPEVNKAVAFICEGELKVLRPKRLHKIPSLTLLSTRMQEATAPIEMDLTLFEGQFVRITWQVDDGQTFWGVDLTPIYPNEVMGLPFE